MRLYQSARSSICLTNRVQLSGHCVPRVAARDSGKTMVDAAFGEVMVTCEKLWWLIKYGERWLRPESRAAGIMVRLNGLRPPA